MKKTIVATLIFFTIILSIGTAYATVEVNTLENQTAENIIGVKEETQKELEEYNEKYGSEAYGLAAYILNMARKLSIPICFIGIVLGALYQYVLGTRRLDMKHKGYGIIMTFVTLLVICQVLPLIFAIVVKGWRG